jgi:small subunit ribosomal protein S6
MNYYEHTLITKQDLQENKVKTFINKYIDIINNNSGKVIKTENWGLKNFSHKIKNNKKGFYFHIKFEGVGKTIEELEKAENIDQMLIRYLTVRVKEHDLKNEYFEKKEI